jgi:hypothetical protein
VAVREAPDGADGTRVLDVADVILAAVQAQDFQ